MHPTLHLWIATAVFALAIVLSALRLRGEGGRAPSTRMRNLILMGVGFVFQTLFLQVLGGARGRCPLTDLPEVLVFLAWTVVLIYFVVGSAYRLSLLGAFTAPLVLLLQIIALAGGVGRGFEEIVRAEDVDPWLELHASVSLMAYGAFALAAVAGVMYLLQNRRLKERAAPTGLLGQLPPVHHLGSAVVRLVLWGFVLLTIGIAAAFGMDHFPAGSKLALTTAVWVIYGIFLLFVLLRRPPSQTLAKIAIIAFLLPLLTLTLLHA